MMKPTEELLRDVFAEVTEPISPATDLYAGTGAHNRRRRRHQVVAAAVAAVVVAAGVPLTLAGVRGGSAEPTAVAPTTPRTTVRGSLGGDKVLVDQAIQLLLQEAVQLGKGTVDRSTVQVSYAEQSEGYRIVVLAGARPDGSVISMVAGGAPGAALKWVAGGTGTRQPQDAGLGQQYYAPQHVLTRFTIGDRSFGLVLFPDGYRATIKRGPSIAADCTLATAPATALPVPSFFPIERGDAPNVAVVTAQGKRATAQALQPTGNASAVLTPPPAAEIAAQVASSIRGKKSVATEQAGYVETFVYGTGVGTLPDRYVGVWAGDLPTGKGYAALWGGHYPSGAVVLQGNATDQGGQGFSGWFTGCVPAGGLNTTVIASRLTTRNTQIPGSPIVIVAPAAAVTAEVSFGSGAPVTVPLTQGGGFLLHGGTAGRVRALDASGRVVGTGIVDQRPIGLPLQPR
jgi:hypothetical protein